jgi:serine protease Do
MYAIILLLLSSHATVAVHADGSLQGSGTVVGDGLVAVASHIVVSRKGIVVRTWGGKEYPASVVATDEDNDLCLLKVNARLAYLPLGIAAVGEGVTAIGHPSGKLWQRSSGTVKLVGKQIFLPTGEVLLVIEADALVNVGSSGGPLVSERGEVVGMVMAFREGRATYAIPADRIKALARKHLK